MIHEHDQNLGNRYLHPLVLFILQTSLQFSHHNLSFPFCNGLAFLIMGRYQGVNIDQVGLHYGEKPQFVHLL